MELTKAARSRIQGLTRINVETTFAGMRRFTKNSRWVGKKNRYARNTIRKIQSDQKAGRIRNPRHLAQYITASSVLHCADGWSYLGKSILSLLRGDPHRSRHLAYYAELRAAMSLLATEGIGIFSRRHFAVNAPHSVIMLQANYPTHQFAWDCLNFWATLSSSGELFAKTVRPYGRNLNNWFAPLGGGKAVAPQAREWFRQWGIDLKVFAQDRDARNESSYRPDGMPDIWSVEAPAALNFARGVWEALEPSSMSSFDAIDRHILRLALESRFKGITGKKSHEDPVQYRNFVNRIIRDQNFSEPATNAWFNFVTRETMPDNLSIFDFSQKSTGSRDNSAVAVISRAILLLRIASGSTAFLIEEARITASSLSFWWETLGQVRGLWDGPREPEELTDLWSDIATLLVDIEQFQTNYAAVDQSFFRVGTEIGHTLAGLSDCERVAIWSMTPA